MTLSDIKEYGEQYGIITFNEALQAMLALMQNCAKSDDNESAHYEADRALVTVIELLATDDNRELINAIIAAYHEVGKWYA